MYRAKALGKNRCQFFDVQMAALATRRLDMETALRRGIPGEMFLLYQPQSSVPAGRIVAVEALVRWQHPERGIVLPGEFLSVAEESGQLARLGNWVLQTACRQAELWQREQGTALRVAVNISSFQLNEPGFPSAVDQLLRECHLDPSQLELELAEASVMCRIQESTRALCRLKEMGVSLALDNFGTGCASLLSLKKLPIDRLKIDRTFIGDLQHSKENLGIVRMIIAMARSLSLQVVAVGVEDASQLEILRNEGCDEFQGHLLARPLLPEELKALVNGR
jgi:EAL domain-containing protein (putative c-di-GMP-specific phosphodiesterase class I)